MSIDIGFSNLLYVVDAKTYQNRTVHSAREDGGLGMSAGQDEREREGVTGRVK